MCYVDKDITTSINNSNIARVNVTTFLGKHIDEKLNWKMHIGSLKTKLSKSSVIMFKAKSKLDNSGLYTLCCSLFLPYLTYCTEVWGNGYATNISCLFMLQKMVVHLICGANHLVTAILYFTV